MASAAPAENPTPLDVLPWLKTLPLAPEYHPTLAEFQDPISYILKIEKEASSYGICKIVPPLPAPPRKTAVSNLNRSFAARNGTGCGGPRKVAPTFTTRQQQIGFCPRKLRPAQRPVWQSGEQYTLQQFEAKAKQFEKTQMKRFGRKGSNAGFSPLEVETLFWKASADKPFMVEYANDMPGSGFAPLLLHSAAKKWREEDTCNVGHTMWNMRGVSRAKGSLLEFMKEEIPGVTSPMVYVAMLFSWFAWHVEDHELHSLNYMHIGAGKTWYGVPRDAGLAFEEVVRVHGYGGEVNPLVTFATLGEKTTVMSPEVLIGAGVPCCRLVQNAGDFVITFPGSYHCGFSHGFNCGEAANVATPEWLKVAKQAAVRRASINYPPMVSHFQLLYDLALSLWSRTPVSNVTEPRSSRLKDKMKGEGEVMIKELFVENAIQNNNLLHILLGKGSSCVVLPQNTLDVSFHSNPRIRSQAKFKPIISPDICSHNEEKEASTGLSSEGFMFNRSILHERPNASSYMNKSPFSICQEKKHHCVMGSKVEYAGSCTTYNTENTESNDKCSAFQSEGLLDQGLLSCVACGILSFACVAIIQPTDAAAVHLMSADCSSFDNQSAGTTFIFETRNDKATKANTYDLTPASVCSERVEKSYFSGFMDNLEDPSHHLAQHSRQVVDSLSESVVQKGPSALDLLASAYGNSSDSEENIQHENLSDDETDFRNSSVSSLRNENPKHLHNGFSSQSPHPGEHEAPTLSRTDVKNEAAGVFGDPSSRFFSCNQFDDVSRMMNDTVEYISPQNKLENAEEMGIPGRSNAYVRAPFSTEVTSAGVNNSCLITEKADVCLRNTRLEIPSFRSEQYSVVPDSRHYSNVSANEHAVVTAQCNKLDASLLTSSNSFMHRPDKDSSRMHIFCLEHALEVENQLRPLGGAHVMILCHPDYPKLEAEAKTVAEELRINYKWKDIHFKDATKEDRERIQSALEDEEVIPANSDWAVKMHVNLYYSSNLSRSPLYSKQLPYNAVIYKAFGCNSSGGSPKKLKVFHRRRGRQKKITVAGKWCGKVWMSNQVHPYLAYKNNPEEQEHVEAFELEDTGQELVEADIDYSNQAGTSTRDSFDDIKTAAKSSTGKRKTSMNNSKAKKAKYDKLQTDLEDSIHNSSAKFGRVLRGKTRQPSTPLHDDCEMTGRRKLSLNDESEGGPSTRLRRRSAKTDDVKPKKTTVEKQIKKKGKEASVKSSVTKDEGTEYMCDVDGCSMSFTTKQDLVLHKRNICPVKGCGKKFFSHKYLVQHRRVHMDDRPLKCPWKGCKMTFKWAWARTEHIRVHTGDRPYICMERGCGQTFRFVSDFSRHKRKTGHVSKKGRR